MWIMMAQLIVLVLQMGYLCLIAMQFKSPKDDVGSEAKSPWPAVVIMADA
jgi:hypothetical protein